MSATVPRQNQLGTTDSPSRPAAVDGRAERVVHYHERGDVIVLEPLGQLGRAGIENIRHAARAVAGRPVVIDLRDCILTDPNALADLAGDDGDAADLCFVSRRLTCRTLLARTGITSRFAVFDQVEDALQARTFVKTGYGWAKLMIALSHDTQPVLQTAISVSSVNGRLRAIVQLHGQLCASTAPPLQSELDQLIDDGVTDVTVNLQYLTLCTSHGLDLFDDIHHRVQQRHGGTLRICLDGAPNIVRRVVHLINDNDPTFSPEIIEGTTRLGADRPTGAAR